MLPTNILTKRRKYVMVLGLFVIAYILASLLWIEAVPISASPPSPNDSSSSDCPDGQLSCARRLFDTSSDLSNAAAAVVVATAITAPVKYDFSNIMFWRPQKVGSSTVLSVLVGLSFRFGLRVRPTERMNSVCQRCAQCAMQEEMRRLGINTNAAMAAIDRADLAGAEGIADAVKNSALAKYLTTPRLRELFMFSQGVGRGAGGLIPKKAKRKKRTFEIPEYYDYFNVSVTHEACSYVQDTSTLQWDLKCAFRSPTDVKQLMIVREPLSRSISVYYFWGELAKLREVVQRRGGKKNLKEADISKMKIGLIKDRTPTNLGKFSYHGDEETVPPFEYAMRYASDLFYQVGMPGPSKSWSFFSDTFKESAEYLRSGAVAPLLLERLDESLIALRHAMGWSLADVVVMKPRKALSKHPRAGDWPQEAVKVLNASLHRIKEFDFYDAANAALQMRIDTLTRSGVNFPLELNMLRALRERVAEVCMSDGYLATYKHFVRGRLPPLSGNRFREVEDELTEYSFSLHTHFVYSFDVCGGCEAHAILTAIHHGVTSSSSTDSPPLGATLGDSPVEAIRTAGLLKHLTPTQRETNLALKNCPAFE